MKMKNVLILAISFLAITMSGCAGSLFSAKEKYVGHMPNAAYNSIKNQWSQCMFFRTIKKPDLENNSEKLSYYKEMAIIGNYCINNFTNAMTVLRYEQTKK